MSVIFGQSVTLIKRDLPRVAYLTLPYACRVSPRVVPGDSVARQPRLTIAERSPELRSLAAATVAATNSCATYSSVAFIKWAACPHAIKALVPSFGNFKEFRFQATAWPSYAGIAVYSSLISGLIHLSLRYKAVQERYFHTAAGKTSDLKSRSIYTSPSSLDIHTREPGGRRSVCVHVQRGFECSGLCHLSWLTASMPATTSRGHSYHTLECTPCGITPP
ncbi:hypothetical protein F4775DRAFT_404017 [Biscogniauxia sp. FL1348]|nr:hypothetical protein F4775DRAFT_404017 [Biscogniauxia sp. FL1348]